MDPEMSLELDELNQRIKELVDTNKRQERVIRNLLNLLANTMLKKNREMDLPTNVMMYANHHCIMQGVAKQAAQEWAKNLAESDNGKLLDYLDNGIGFQEKELPVGEIFLQEEHTYMLVDIMDFSENEIDTLEGILSRQIVKLSIGKTNSVALSTEINLLLYCRLLEEVPSKLLSYFERSADAVLKGPSSLREMDGGSKISLSE